MNNNLKEALKIIRYEYMKSLDIPSKYVIIDSFPYPLCATIRNRRAKLFSEIANIGYNATKELCYYGVKIAYELIEQAPSSQVLADNILALN